MSAPRWLTVAVLGLMLAGTASAQRGGFRGGFGGGGFRGGSGIGGRGFGGHSFGRGGFVLGHRGFIGGIGFHHSPFFGGGSFRLGGFRYGFGGWYGRTAWSPGVWWPSTYVPFYSYAEPYPYWAPPVPAVTVVAVPAIAAEPSTIVINDGREAAVVREERQETRTPGWRASGSPLYLIATKSGDIWAARAYWVEAGAVQIITRREERRSIPLDQVDRALSDQLNRERRVDFQLP